MSFISRNAVGVGTTTIAGRDAGIGTAVGTLVYTVGDGIDGGRGQLEIYTDNNEWKAISTEAASSGFTASGGNIANGLEPGNGYAYHTFTGNGTFTLENDGTLIEMLIVGGGGGAGSDNGGGGGAGGLVYVPGYALDPGSYTVTIGPGGAGAPPPRAKGTPGANTTFVLSGPNASITANGGGAGSDSYSDKSGDPGGSGGGAFDPPSSGGTGNQPGQAQPLLPTPSYLQYGNPGGNFGANPTYGSGGGGGAGGAGNQGTPQGPGVGGDGRQYPQFAGPLIGITPFNPLNAYFAGGGTGGADATPARGSRPLGGGGDGGIDTPTDNKAAIGYGSGGGGGPAPTTGGPGSAGIVIIRYPV